MRERRSGWRPVEQPPILEGWLSGWLGGPPDLGGNQIKKKWGMARGGQKKNGDSLKWHFLAWGLGEESRLWNLFRKLLKQLVMFFLKNTHTHNPF